MADTLQPVQPVTQTTKWNPDTGEEEITIKGSASALSADNPNTPTILQPGAKDPYQFENLQAPHVDYLRKQAEANGLNPDYVVNASTFNQSPLEKRKAVYEMAQRGVGASSPVSPEQAQVNSIASGQGTQPAGDLTAEDRAIRQAQSQVTPQAANGPVVPGAPGQPDDAAGVDAAVAAEQKRQLEQDPGIQLADANNGVVSDATAGDPALAAIAARRQAQQDEGGRIIKEQFSNIERDASTPEGRLALQQRAKEEGPSGVGGWLQAYALKRFGFDAEAADLAKKLMGRDTQFQAVVDEEGNTAYVGYDGQGRPVEGIDANGQAMSAEQVRKLGGSSLKGAKTDNNFYYSSDPNIKGRFSVVTQANGRKIVYDEQNKRVTDPKIISTINPLGVPGTQEQQLALHGAKAAQTTSELEARGNVRIKQAIDLINQSAYPEATKRALIATLEGTAKYQVEEANAPRIAGKTETSKLRAKEIEDLREKSADVGIASQETLNASQRIKQNLASNPEVVGLLSQTNSKGESLMNALLGAAGGMLPGDSLDDFMRRKNFSQQQIEAAKKIEGDLTNLSLAAARENKGQGAFTDFERRLFSTTLGDIRQDPANVIAYRMDVLRFAAQMNQEKAAFVQRYTDREPTATPSEVKNAWAQRLKEKSEAFNDQLRDRYSAKKASGNGPVPATGSAGAVAPKPRKSLDSFVR